MEEEQEEEEEENDDDDDDDGDDDDDDDDDADDDKTALIWCHATAEVLQKKVGWFSNMHESLSFGNSPPADAKIHLCSRHKPK